MQAATGQASVRRHTLQQLCLLLYTDLLFSNSTASTLDTRIVPDTVGQFFKTWSPSLGLQVLNYKSWTSVLFLDAYVSRASSSVLDRAGRRENAVEVLHMDLTISFLACGICALSTTRMVPDVLELCLA